VLTRTKVAASAVVLASAGALVVTLSPAPAQAPLPECASDVAAHPAFAAGDAFETDQADKQLFATHPITLTVGFRSGEPQGDPFTEVFTAPPGFTHVTGRAKDEYAVDALPAAKYEELEAAVVIGAQPGPFPASVRWTQTQETGGKCTSSASGDFTLQPAAPPKLSRPKVTGGLLDESTVKLAIPRRGADLRPIEVRYRAHGRQRFPGPAVPVKTMTFPQLDSDSGRRSKLRVRTHNLRLTMDPSFLRTIGMDFVFDVGTSPKGSPYGYDLQVLQGGQQTARLRVSGRCKRTGGAVECAFKRIKLG
jgi:hypothetical protein